jgi:hypothetical protein
MSEPKVTLRDDAPAAASPAALEPGSPSAEMVRKALQEQVITDERGRQLTVRRPGVLAQFRLVEAVGPEAASNQTYMQMINPLLYLGKIDGEDVLPPMSKREVEVLIQRLDEEGLAALGVWYMANVIGPTLDAVKAAEQQAALKN